MWPYSITHRSKKKNAGGPKQEVTRANCGASQSRNMISTQIGQNPTSRPFRHINQNWQLVILITPYCHFITEINSLNASSLVCPQSVIQSFLRLIFKNSERQINSYTFSFHVDCWKIPLCKDFLSWIVKGWYSNEK